MNLFFSLGTRARRCATSGLIFSLIFFSACEDGEIRVEPDNTNSGTILLISRDTSYTEQLVQRPLGNLRLEVGEARREEFDLAGKPLISEFVDCDMEHNLRGRITRDYGTLTYGGYKVKREHSFQIGVFPDSNGVPSHVDTVDRTRYRFVEINRNGQPLQGFQGILDPIRFENKPVLKSVIGNVDSFEVSLQTPTPLRMAVTLGQEISASRAFVVKLNREMKSGVIMLYPQDPAYDSLAVFVGELTKPVTQFVIPKKELASMKSVFPQKKVLYRIRVDEYTPIGVLPTGLSTWATTTHEVQVYLRD